MIELTVEERNVVLALIDAAIKSLGAQLLKDGAGALAESAYKKLSEAKSNG